MKEACQRVEKSREVLKSFFAEDRRMKRLEKEDCFVRVTECPAEFGEEVSIFPCMLFPPMVP